MTVIRTPVVNTGLAAFLDRANAERAARGDAPLPARTADAVLTLLALRGADRRTGVPEPTSRALSPLLHEDLPTLFWGTDEELAAVPAVLAALADHARASGRLNAKRHARLLAAVDAALPDHRRAMADPWNLTWHRWYASLLRADAVDADDPAAVRAWLAAHEGRPRAERPALPAPLHRSDVAARTFGVRARLGELLLGAFARDVEAPSPAGPLLPGPPLDADRPDEELPAELDRIATALSDRWTAAGLGDALTGPDGPYAVLAPTPESIPHFALADRLLGEHLDYYGDPARPLPPPAALPAPEAVRALLPAAPLPAALATGSATVPRELAERCFPPSAAAVWADGTPAELTELAADILAGVVDDIGAGADSPAGSLAGADTEDAQDAAHLLYALYERGGTPDSVVRKAAERSGLPVAPGLEDAPVEVDRDAAAEPGLPYEMPGADRLPGLLGVPLPGEDERARLAAHARSLADVVDRLAATGCVFRAGDAYGLTPLGCAVLRHLLAAGHVAAPDDEEVSEWEAARVVTAVSDWPEHIAVATLTRWTAGLGAPAWGELLAAAEEIRAADFDRVDPAAVFARFALADVPGEALRAALTHPVTGAHAHWLLTGLGEATDVDAARVPDSARAALALETLDAARKADLRAAEEATPAARAQEAARAEEAARAQEAARAEEATPEAPPGPGPAGEAAPAAPAPALPDAFDAAASVWPGGAPALVPALADADPPTARKVLSGLAESHPDPAVASLAARTVRRALAARRARAAKRARTAERARSSSGARRTKGTRKQGR
ncbi:hypothetical protein [Streptomyces sp. NPDC015131]|uniref:hypothetical protein n=1 Tax=Streptomyces sp. NPDC015131 TaxID=3364941 RepID=UPI0036FEFFB9